MVIMTIECGGPPAEDRVTLTGGNWPIAADDLAYQWEPLQCVAFQTLFL